MKKFFEIREQLLESTCPIATLDVDINVKNRQHAIDEYHYGPANPNEPGTFWKNISKIWDISEQQAKTMKCENCAAFDVSDKMRGCIEKGIIGKEDGVDGMATINKADLGYCNLLHFKCAGSRTCSLWLTNGPIDNKDLT